MKEPTTDWERQLAGNTPFKNGFTSDLERKVRERIGMNRAKGTNRGGPFRTIAAMMSVVLLLSCVWWFRDDIKNALQPAQHSDIPAALVNDPLADQEYELKVQQFNTYNTFEYTYKRPFVIRHPSVKVSISRAADKLYTDPEGFDAWFDKEQPDVVQLPMNLFARLSREGKLKSLDVLVKANKFDLKAFHQPLIDLLRQTGGSGELYGLSADFTTMALYVNEDVFSAKGVPLPDKSMTMEEILQLAGRFQGTGVSGLGVVDRSNKFALIKLIGQSEGLQTITAAGNHWKATVNSEAWKKIWSSVADGFRTGWLDRTKPTEYGKNGNSMKEIAKQDPFATGKAAMIINPSYYYTELKMYEQSGVMKSNWTTVPIAIDPSATNSEAYLGTNTVYAINAKSTQSDAAWEMLQFIAGGSWRTNLDPNSYFREQLLANETAMDQSLSKQWRAFYEKSVDPAKVIDSLKLKSELGYSKAEGMLNSLGDKAMDDILNRSVSVDAALEDFQNKLDNQLAAIVKEGQP